MTGGCNSGDENPFMEDNKHLKELTIHVWRADIKVWNIKNTNLIFPACMTGAAAVQWSDSCFSAFGYYDPQQSMISDKLIQLTKIDPDQLLVTPSRIQTHTHRLLPTLSGPHQDMDIHFQRLVIRIQRRL